MNPVTQILCIERHVLCMYSLATLVLIFHRSRGLGLTEKRQPDEGYAKRRDSSVVGHEWLPRRGALRCESYRQVRVADCSGVADRGAPFGSNTRH